MKFFIFFEMAKRWRDRAPPRRQRDPRAPARDRDPLQHPLSNVGSEQPRDRGSSVEISKRERLIGLS